MAYQFDYAAYTKTTKIGDKEVTTRCGRIVNKKELDIDALAAKLIDDGFVKSLKKDELKAVLDAYYRGAKSYVYEGYIVRTGFAALQAKLNGALGENDTIGEKTRLRIELAPRDDLKLDKSECSFHNVAAEAKVNIQTISWNGSTNPGELKKEENILATGSNLMFNKDIGDEITCEYNGATITCSVDGSGYQMLSVAWPAELSEAAIGTEITFKFTLHGGDANVNPKVISKTAKIVG